jgi:hypothetical protein
MLNSTVSAGRYHCPVCDPNKQHSRSFKVSTNACFCFRCSETGSLTRAHQLLLGQEPIRTFKKLDQANAETAAIIYDRAKGFSFGYLLERGYPEQIVECALGFAEHSHALQEVLKWDAVKGLGLDSRYNNLELFNQRVVFTIRNAANQITHFQARSIDSDNNCKWLASNLTEGALPISSALYNAHKLKQWKADGVRSIVLCEGVTDALALECLGVPVVATFGIQRLNLDRHVDLFDFNIVALYDNDCFPLSTTKLSGKEKSWPSILPQLAAIQRNMSAGNLIHTLDVPKISGLKDAFDLCKYLEWDLAAFLSYGEQNTQLLASKIAKVFGIENPDTLKHLAGIPCPEFLMAQLEQAIKNQGGWLNAIAASFY